MNQKVIQKPDAFFIKWAKSQGINTSLADYKNYTGEGRGWAFNEYSANLFYQVFLKAINNPNLSAFEDEVSSLEFNFDRVKKPKEVLYKNDWTRKAYHLWQTICGKAEAILEGRTNQTLTNNTAEVSND